MAVIIKIKQTLERIYKQIGKINDLKSEKGSESNTGENNIITAINY